MQCVNWQQLIEMMNEYLIYVQEDNSSSNDKINDVKLLIHKLQRHIDRLVQQSYKLLSCIQT